MQSWRYHSQTARPKPLAPNQLIAMNHDEWFFTRLPHICHHTSSTYPPHVFHIYVTTRLPHIHLPHICHHTSSTYMAPHVFHIYGTTRLPHIHHTSSTYMSSHFFHIYVIRAGPSHRLCTIGKHSGPTCLAASV